MRSVGRLVFLIGLVAGLSAGAWAQDEEWDGWEAWRQSGGAGGADGRAGREALFSRGGFSDEAVRQAIQRGCNFLWSQRLGDGSWPGYNLGQDKQFPSGPTALAAYALLAAGVSPLDKRMEQTLDWLSKQDTEMTYTLGLRCNAWLLANKLTRGKYMEVFKRDVQRLILSTRDGSYNYWCRADGQSSGDNSNSQYAVLGTWAGAMGIREIPQQYWRKVEQHWRECQKDDGGWGYNRNESASATMTVGGIATLFVCFDELRAEQFLRCNVHQEYKPIEKGLDWIDAHFQEALGGSNLMGHGDLCYFLYGVERVGLACGYKYFGKADWYKLGARRLLSLEQGGSWNVPRGRSPVINTSFAILFLVRGQHPVAFNKLEYKGDWCNRPRDLAGLTRWMTDAFERTVNWQIVNLKVDVEEWHDAPILYIAGSVEPQFTDEQIDKLRRYVWQGGTILSITECNGKAFGDGIRKVYQKAFPDYQLKPVRPDHPLYTVYSRLKSPTFYEMDNGVRPLVLHTDTDLPRSWQLQMRNTDRESFEIAANILMYVTDMQQLRHRGVTHWPPAPAGNPAAKVKLARLKYNGKWDPEPLAYERFGRLLAMNAQIGLEVISPVEVAQVEGCGARIATLTGTEQILLNSEEKAALKRFVQNGGTLVVDAAGGSPAFAESAEAVLSDLFGRSELRRLASSAPVFTVPGMEIKGVSYRRKARTALGRTSIPNLKGAYVGDRLAVIFSREDLTGGLVGVPVYNCVGYQPRSAYELMRNIVVWASGVKRK